MEKAHNFFSFICIFGWDRPQGGLHIRLSGGYRRSFALVLRLQVVAERQVGSFCPMYCSCFGIR